MTENFTMPIPDGFKKTKKNKHEAKNERQKKVTAFITDYKNLCEKHNLKLDSFFNYTPKGQAPDIDVRFLVVPKEYENNPEQIQKDKNKIGKLVEPFLKEYGEIKERHQLRFVATLEITDTGIIPKMSIGDVPAVKLDADTHK